MKKTIGSILILITCYCVSSAQAKWGQEDPKIFQNRTYPQDESANAIVLSETEAISFDYDQGGVWVIYKVHRRIQLLRKEGFENANVSISFHSERDQESIYTLEAQTLNVDENGQITKTEVPENAIFKEKKSDYVTADKFAFPNVKEGSVVEFRYTLKSRYIRFLHSWSFQSALPTVYSSVSIQTPFFMHYGSLAEGPVEHMEASSEPTSAQFPASAFSRESFPNERRIIDWTRATYVMTYTPAIKEEGFTTTINDYEPRISFALSSINIPNTPVKTFTENWDQVTDEITKNDDFGLMLNGAGNHLKLARDLALEIKDPLDRLKSIYTIVSHQIKWNEKYSLFPSKKLKESFDEKSGNSADINMVLLDMLRAAKINADPLLVSTRSNGKVHYKFPDIRQFNHVVVVAEIDSQKIFLDAINPFRPYDLISQNDINSLALRPTQNGVTWETINPRRGSGAWVTATINLDTAATVSGKVSIINKDYEALDARTYLAEKKLSDYLDNKIHKEDKIELSNAQVEGKDSIDKKIKISFDYKEGKDEAAGPSKIIYLHPFPVYFRTENPFKLKQRDYPVNFGHTFEETFRTTVLLPAGFKVSDLPKTVNLALPDGGATYTLAVQATDNLIQLNSSFKINKIEFAPEQYDALKDIFNRMIDAVNSTIVIEKQ